MADIGWRRGSSPAARTGARQRAGLTPASASNTLSCQRETLHSQQLRSIKKSIDSDHGIYCGGASLSRCSAVPQPFGRSRRARSSRRCRPGFIVAARPAAERDRIAAFSHRLRELGWIESRNIAIDFRSAEVRLKVDVIVIWEFPPGLFAAINVVGGRAVGECELLHSFSKRFA